MNGAMAELGRKRIEELAALLRVQPGSTAKLPADFKPGFIAEFPPDGGDRASEALKEGVEILAEYQDRLSAQDAHAVLVILQGLDAAGKDGTIKHVMGGVNPQWVDVHAFKEPSAEELNHDYLWRYAQKLPARGKIGIFNRSHYEEVLVVRVHPELLDAQHMAREKGDALWHHRFHEINEWERYLDASGIHLVKLFLNLSREVQRKRFLERIDKADKNWKFTAADVRERAYWNDYQSAYSAVLTNTSTDWAPWYVIPSDHKWFTHIAAAAVIAHTLMKIDPHYPVASPQAQRELAAARRDLLAEGPKGGAGTRQG